MHKPSSTAEVLARSNRAALTGHFAALILTFLSLSLPSLVCAQSTNGSLIGRVTDGSKAVIVGATVVAIRVDTNVRYETATNPTGDYVLTNLTPGAFRIEVEKAGFRKIIKPDVMVHVQDSLTVDFELPLGPVIDTVTVEAGAPLVNTQSATVSTVVDRTFVENLPLNGRSFQTLIMLTPGVVVTPTAFDDQGQFSVNGQRADANYFMVDGVSANFGVTGYFPMVQSAGGALPALSAAGGTNSLASVDAMEEFRIQTSSFAPEFGRTPGGQISIVTRSGTNGFHGSAFEYFRNDALDSKDWFVTQQGLPKPEEEQHDFGGTTGGPVVRNRTFFFFSHESLRLRQPSSEQTVVPDTASRQQGPASTRPFLNAYPVPNGPALGPGLAQFSASFSNPSSLDADSIRVDHSVNANLNLFARYNSSPSNLDQRGGSFSSSGVLSQTSSISSSVHTLTGGLTHVINQAVSHEFRANYSVQRVGLIYSMDGFGGAVPLQDAQLFPPGYSSADSGFLFYITGIGEYAQGKIGTDKQRQVNLLDNVTVVKGGHLVKFGFDYRWLAPFSSPFVYRQFAQFSGVTSAPGGALSGKAAFVQPGVFQENELRSQNVSLYGQDTWSISSRLTATYGLRWDVNPPLRGKDLANDPFTVVGLDNPATMTLAPRGTPLYETTYGNVAPRVGLAYRLGQASNRETIVRAGAGVFYDLGQGSLGGTTSYFPYFATKSIPSPAPFPLSVQDAMPPPFSDKPPVLVIVVADPHLKLPRSYQWNFALEQSLGSSQSLSATYIGAVGRDLLRVTQLFNPNPDFSSVALTDNSATSDYHALQISYRRRLSRGFQATASYTLAHSTDDASTDAFATYLNTPGVSGAASDHGDSDFDIRHAFTGSVTYFLPSPKSQGLSRALFGGWSLDAFVLARSAPPVDVIGGVTFASGTALRYRPNVNPGVPLDLYGPQYAGGKIFNPAAFAAAPAGQQGNLGRNVLRGFAGSQTDLAVERQCRVTGNIVLRFKAEVFNIFNQANFGSPIADVSSPLFGQSTQTLANSLGAGGANGGFSPLYQIGGPRSIQLVARLQF